MRKLKSAYWWMRLAVRAQINRAAVICVYRNTTE